MTRHIARLATRQVRYLEAGAGRALVLLHAFPLNAEQWLPQLAHPPAGWRMVAFDARGFGATPPGGGGLEAVSMDTYAADAFELMAHLDMPKAVVCGLSLGGYVALAMQRRAPDRVAALVLADTRAGADSDDARRGREAMLELVDREGPAGVARQMLPKLLAPATARERPDLVDVVRGMIDASAPDAIAAAVRAMRDRPDSRALLGEIGCPALVLVGEDDAVTPPEEARAMVASLRDARLTILPGVGHLSNLEDPAGFNGALHEWLASLPAPA